MKVASIGVEHSPIVNRKPHIQSERGTESGTVGDNPANKQQRADSDLTNVVKAWPKLPAAIKAGIMALVKAAKG